MNALKADWKFFLALKSFLSGAAAKGVYLSALAPEDLRWTGKGWVVFKKSGTLRLDLSAHEIHERYRDRILKRWGLDIVTGGCERLLTKGSSKPRGH